MNRFFRSFAMMFVFICVTATLLKPIHAAESEKPSAYIVSFGLFGSQSVFDSEARAAAGVLSNYFHAVAQPFIRSNTKNVSQVTSAALSQSMRNAKRAMKRDRDILVLFLTSHGTQRGIAVEGQRISGVLAPSTVGQMLRTSGARYRILIVSACFSGIFADKLADRNTLVITAAASDRTSFGCEDRVAWTYFGQAFFRDSLQPGRPLREAFDAAKESIQARERAETITPPSNPQFRGGEAVLKRLGQ